MHQRIIGFNPRMETHRQQHFLFATYPVQGHINPSLHLAKCLAQSAGALITFSTSISAHIKMFPNLQIHDQELKDGLISYIPYDGYEEGYDSRLDNPSKFLLQFNIIGSQSLSSIVNKLNSSGRHVTGIIYTFMLPWAADVARNHGILSAHYWIQPATVFTIYHHFFHGYDTIIASQVQDVSSIKLPGLPLLQKSDLPPLANSSSSNDMFSIIFSSVKEAILLLDREQALKKPKVLVNTFDELEPDALAAIDTLDLIAVGPILQPFVVDNATVSSSNLPKSDEKAYMEWLDSKEEKSVVYISFGTVVRVKKQQMEEMSKGLKASGKSYLWVVRKDCRDEDLELDENGVESMVIEWCSQVSVLSHPSVGCFVTHCGWNSMLESLTYGVPTVGVPQWSDQGTNAMLANKVWGTGVRSQVNTEGVVEGGEIARCLDLVMGDGERGEEIRRKAEIWKLKAREAIGEGGSSYQNIRTFVDAITTS